MTLQPGPEGKDTYIGSRPDLVNTGNPHHRLLPAMAWTWSGVPGALRGLIDFDIPPLPDGGTLIKATLVLSAETTGSSPRGHSQEGGTNTWRLIPITSSWEETTATWNNQPSVDESRAIALPSSNSYDQTYQVDVTAHVATKLSTPSLMRGWMLRLQSEDSHRAIQFATSDHPTIAVRPKLLLEYTQAVPLGRISGRVIRGSCDTACGLQGVLVDAGGGHYATTAPDGTYTLTNLPLGTYTLRASLRGGWTFGSFAFQNEHYTVSISRPGQLAWASDIVGWDRDPVVFVHGWNSDVSSDFGDVPARLREAGYYVHDSGQLTGGRFTTPPLFLNSYHVRDWTREVRYETGRAKTILYGQSMGGLVSRAYVEGPLYAGDVSQLFAFGSPHLGAPGFSYPSCLVETFNRIFGGALCDMTPAGMRTFNLIMRQRAGVDYHLTGGDAPTWRWQRKCMKILWWKICVNLPLPDHEFRNGNGWWLGALIAGKDDGFIQTRSALGMAGRNIDRFITRETHSKGFVGYRDYHMWENGPSQEGFARCGARLLIDRTSNTCGTRLFNGPPPGAFLSASQPSAASPLFSATDDDPASPALNQLSRLDTGGVSPGSQKVRSVLVEGGPTSFTASWDRGTARFYVIDPSGQVIDPESLDAAAVDPSDPEAEDATEPPPGMALYSEAALGATYYFPAASRGTWQLVLKAGTASDTEAISYSTQAVFDSPLGARLVRERPSFEPGQPAHLRMLFSEPVQAAEVQLRIRHGDGSVQEVALERLSGTEYVADPVIAGPSGFVNLVWSVTGQRMDGVSFERGGQEDVQINSTALRLGTGHSDRAIPREGLPGLNSALAVHLQVRSDYAGEALGVFGELAALDGSTITTAFASVPAVQGVNDVELRFRAEEIFAAGKDGPYLVREVKLVDTRGALLLSQEIPLAHTTAPYSYRSFSSVQGKPAAFVDEGPYRVVLGQSITLKATGADPEGQPLTYAWDLDGDGVFESPGQSVLFTAPSQAPVGLQTVRVQVTDTDGNSAQAETSVERIINHPPIAQCQNVTVLADATTCTGSASVNAGSYDPDSEGGVTCSQAPDGVYSQGAHPVVLSCADSTGLTASCVSTVTVRDVTPPAVICPAPLVMNSSGPEGAWVTPAAATAQDGCSNATVSGPPAGLYPNGITEVTYTAVDATGNTSQCSTSIEVVPGAPPQLTMCNMPRYTRELSQLACGWATSGEGGPRVTRVFLTIDGQEAIPLTPDNSGGFVYTTLNLEEGTHQLELTAVNAEGGFAQRRTTVTIDRTPPVLSVLSPAWDAVLPGPVVDVTTSVQDVSPTKVVTQWTQSTQVEEGTGVVTHRVDLVNWGAGVILVSATDAAGNTSQTLQQVQVLPPTSSP
ncbi:DNRLRE domain-containing protein [Corallococcus exercitus]|uniref:DNRLRE domain-containing protein n=1 Tax=Corallococcus exercitus TaxID=2316736 RepID=UPI0013152A7D|nr:DNRLRE domain-containing protein [Corallococcus exercitus]